jgi:Ca-activated chloride channel family protein
MRHSLLALAVASALLAACSTTTPNDAQVADANAPTRSDAPRDEEIQTAPTSELDAVLIADDTRERQQVATGGARRELAKAAEDKDVGAAAAQPMMEAPVEMEAMPTPIATPMPTAPPMAMRIATNQAGLAGALAATAEPNTEHYESLPDNPVVRTADNPVSTFSIDVDTGSYTNVRAMLAQNQRPPADAVRAEEMINYFDYGYPAPASRETPFRVSTEVAAAPWDGKRLLLQVGIQGYRVPASSIPASNLVFLIDTSGSMDEPDKLPLLKAAFSSMVESLREQDRVSIVVYAGSAGLVLPPTSGADKDALLGALDRLSAGGSTNGGEGLQLAYAQARAGFIAGGVNRVILATDGDFNVGTFDQKALETLIGDQRQSGIALTTLGFGRGNYNDAMAEQLADVGNGNHAYIDSLAEGRRVLVEEMSSTLMTIAQDVKIQLEFNPAVVAEYRLIGYENRALRREDFNNDRIDAGEIGAGHDVTALYEIALVGSGGERSDPLRYGAPVAHDPRGDELGLLKLRYKLPGATTSRLISSPLSRQAVARAPSERLRFAASVAAYADLLRGGGNVGAFGWAQVRALAAGSMGEDPSGRRHEFVQLIDRARGLAGDASQTPVAVSE